MEATASKRGRMSRRKGVTFERYITNRLKDALGELYTVRRGFQTRGGGEAPDVGIFDQNMQPVVHCECKHGQRPNLIRALEQAWGDANPHALPVAVTRQNNQPVMVTMRFDEWLSVMADWLTLKHDCEQGDGTRIDSEPVKSMSSSPTELGGKK